MIAFVKRYPEKGEFPSVSKKYFTSHGYLDYSVKRKEFAVDGWLLINVKWWLEEIELPDQEKLEASHDIAYKPDMNGYTNGYIRGYKKAMRYILTLLKQN